MLTFEEQLIDRVRRFDLLYNKRSSLYKIPQKRDESWLNISMQLGVKVEHCKQRWKSLRDRFVREHKKVLSGDIHDSDVWEYYKELLFLKDYLQTRKPCRWYDATNTEYASIEVKSEPDIDQLETVDSEYKPDDGEYNTKDTEVPLLSPEPEYSDCGNYSLEDMSSSTDPPIKKHKPNMVEDSLVDFIGGMKRLVDKKRDSRQHEETENQLFMRMIAKKLDLLPLTSQANLQIDILTMVNNEVKRCANGN